MGFTKEELEEMYKSQLVNLAGYYGIDLKMSMLKGEMIDAILRETEDVKEVELPPMSVRVRRIYDRSKK